MEDGDFVWTDGTKQTNGDNWLTTSSGGGKNEPQTDDRYGRIFRIGHTWPFKWAAAQHDTLQKFFICEMG